MSEENEFNLSVILENIHNFLSDLKSSFEARSSSCVQVFDEITEILSNQDQLNLLINQIQFREALIKGVSAMNDFCKIDDPNFIKKLELIIQMVKMSKAGISLAHNENKKIV